MYIRNKGIVSGHWTSSSQQSRATELFQPFSWICLGFHLAIFFKKALIIQTINQQICFNYLYRILLLVNLIISYVLCALWRDPCLHYVNKSLLISISHVVQFQTGQIIGLLQAKERREIAQTTKIGLRNGKDVVIFHHTVSEMWSEKHLKWVWWEIT